MFTSDAASDASGFSAAFPARENARSGSLKVMNTASILDAAGDGRPLTPVEALHLLQLHREDDLQALRQTADAVRRRQVGDGVFYHSATSIYLTNYCELSPALYDYPKAAGDERGCVLTIDGIDELLERALSQQVQQLYLSGGGYWSALVVPGLEAPSSLKTYAKVLSHLRERAPGIEILAFSPDEIDFLSIVSDRNEAYLLELFQDLGLRGLGGHGAEILVDAVRQQISPKKATVKRWFEIVSAAQRLGVPVQAPLEAGPLATLSQRVAHLDRLRQFMASHTEEDADTGESPFSVLIPQMWTRLPSALRLADTHRPLVRPEDRLKLTAVMRLFLGDILPDQQVFWQPNGVTEAQDALTWGANGLGGTNALSHLAFLSDSGGAQGVRKLTQEFTADDFKRLILETGRKPALLPVPSATN
jgi:FO synthase subunit 2